MLHAIYRLNLFGGAKMPEPPEGRGPEGRPGSKFRPVMPPPGGGHGGPGGRGPRF